MFDSLLSPAGAIMFPLAIAFDLLGMVCLFLDVFAGIGEIPSWILDLIGLLTIGVWTFFYTGTMPTTKKTGELAQKAKTKLKDETSKLIEKKVKKEVTGKVLKRFVITFLGEIAPVVGGLPFWTWHVYKTLKEGSEKE